MQSRLLIVDGDISSSRPLMHYLTEAGYEVGSAQSVRDAKSALEVGLLGAILLDVQLPDGSGLDLIPDIQKRSRAGIILMSQHCKAIDRIIGLDMGADDYIGKPYEPREVLARVNALLRRLSNPDDPVKPALVPRSGTVQHFQGWSYDPENRRLILDEGTIQPLTRAEFSILDLLIRNRNHIMERALIMGALTKSWTPADRTIDIVVGRLRRKITATGTHPNPIITVYGKGYVFKSA